jgi:periplasmic divalent cation tolerance protein
MKESERREIMKEYIQIVTTMESKESAEKMGNLLVENKLAACVQVSGPITSIYQWEDKMEQSQEYYCIIKTEKKRYSQIEHTIKKNHSYEVPEIIVLPILKGNPDYLNWISEIVTQ